MICGLGLALAAPLSAQIYSPKNIDTKTEGALFAYYHARYMGGHMQYGDGEKNAEKQVASSGHCGLRYLLTDN